MCFIIKFIIHVNKINFIFYLQILLLKNLRKMADCETAWKKQKNCIIKVRTGELSCDKAKREINQIRNNYGLSLMDPFTLLFYKEINDIIWERENGIRHPSPNPDIITENIEKKKNLRYQNKNKIKNKKNTIYQTECKRIMENYKKKMEDIRNSKKVKKNCF